MSVTPGVNISELADHLERHTRENPELLTQRLLGLDGVLDYATLLVDVVDEVPLTELFTNEVVQPGGKDTFNPKELAGFKQRIGKVRSAKVDMTLTPTRIDAMWRSWLGQQMRGTGADVYDIPFEQEIYNRIIDQVVDDMRMKVNYKGVYNASGTAAADVMDGWIKKITDAIAADEIPASHLVPTPEAITSANALDKFELLVNIIPDKYWTNNMVAICSPATKRKYEQDYRNSHGALPYNTEFRKTVLDGTEIELVAEPGLTGTDWIIVTERGNLVWMIDTLTKMAAPIIEKEKRNLHMLLDYKVGVDFGIAEKIWLYQDPASIAGSV